MFCSHDDGCFAWSSCCSNCCRCHKRRHHQPQRGCYQSQRHMPVSMCQQRVVFDKRNHMFFCYARVICLATSWVSLFLLGPGYEPGSTFLGVVSSSRTSRALGRRSSLNLVEHMGTKAASFGFAFQGYQGGCVLGWLQVGKR